MSRALGKKYGSVAGPDGVSYPAYGLVSCDNPGSRKLAISTGKTAVGSDGKAYPAYELAQMDNGGVATRCCGGYRVPKHLTVVYHYVSGGCTFYDQMAGQIVAGSNFLYPGCDQTTLWAGGLGVLNTMLRLQCVDSGHGCEWQYDPGDFSHPRLHPVVTWPGGACSDPFLLTGQVTLGDANQLFQQGCYATAPPFPANWPGLPYYQPSVYNFEIFATRPLRRPVPSGLAKLYGQTAGEPAYGTAGCADNNDPVPNIPCCLSGAPSVMTAVVSAPSSDPLYSFVSGWTFPLTLNSNPTYPGCWYGTDYRVIYGFPLRITLFICCPNPNFNGSPGLGEASLIVTQGVTWDYATVPFLSIGGGTDTFGPRCRSPYLFTNVDTRFPDPNNPFNLLHSHFFVTVV